MTLTELAATKYALLTTYRRDGRAVATPVWIVGRDGGLAVWTYTGAGKVKRVRRTPAVTVATCDGRGRNAGPAVSGRAVVLDAAGSADVRALIRRKYGLAGRLTIRLSLIRRGPSGTVGIQIALDPSTGDPAGDGSTAG